MRLFFLKQFSSQDLSGTRVQSSAPVNVYSGNIRVKVSLVENGQDITTGSRDHIVEQLIPVDRWGSVFNIQPIPDRTFGEYSKSCSWPICESEYSHIDILQHSDSILTLTKN